MPDRKLTPAEIQQQMIAGTRRARANERIQRDPITALVEGAKAFGNHDAAYAANVGLQEAAGRSKKGFVRGAGRVYGEAPMYIDQIIPLLKLLDQDVDEKDRAIALGYAMSMLGVNAGKDYLMARAGKDGKMSGAANAVTDQFNPHIASVVGKYYTKPYEALGNVSPAEIMYQMGKILPPSSFFGLPAIPQAMEMGAKANIGRTPFVKNLRTQIDRQEDTLTEDELLYHLMRLKDPNTPVPDENYTYQPTSNSKDQKKKANVLNKVSSAVTAKHKTILPFAREVQGSVADPEQYVRNVFANALLNDKFLVDTNPSSKGRGTGGRALPVK